MKRMPGQVPSPGLLPAEVSPSHRVLVPALRQWLGRRRDGRRRDGEGIGRETIVG